MIDLAEIEAARELLRGVAIETPVETSRWLSDVVGAPVRLKCENLQRTGSFKIRGAYVRISRLSPEERERGVVAASAGNHAQGVALAAQMLGIRATVFMPEGAPIPKERATRAYGAEVIFSGHSVDDCLVAARAHEEQTGAVLIHPFDHPDILAGQGTAGLEILDQVPDAATVVVPTGGGGLVGGIAVAIKQRRPDVRLVAVQAEEAASYPPSLASGHPLALPSMKTMADGILVGMPGAVPFEAVREYVDEVRTVSEESISRALLSTLERAKLVVEPAGVVGVSALLDDPSAFAGGPVVVVLSGGNIDPLLLGKVIHHGMLSAGRYLRVTVRVSDAPGALARMLQEVAALGANVVEVGHARHNAGLALDQVEVVLALETRGEPHAEQVVAHLRAEGYPVAI